MTAVEKPLAHCKKIIQELEEAKAADIGDWMQDNSIKDAYADVEFGITESKQILHKHGL